MVVEEIITAGDGGSRAGRGGNRGGAYRDPQQRGASSPWPGRGDIYPGLDVIRRAHGNGRAALAIGSGSGHRPSGSPAANPAIPKGYNVFPDPALHFSAAIPDTWVSTTDGGGTGSALRAGASR